MDNAKHKKVERERMEPIEFNEQTEIVKTNYIPFPIHYDNFNGRGKSTSCWKLTWKERFKIFRTGIIWNSQLTFGKTYQPTHLSVTKPIQTKYKLFEK